MVEQSVPDQIKATPETTGEYRIPTRSTVAIGVIAVISLIGVGIALAEVLVISAGFISGIVLSWTAARTTYTGGLQEDLFGVGFLVAATSAIGIPAYALLMDGTAVALISLGSTMAGFGAVQLQTPLVGNGSLVDALGWLARVVTVLVLCTGVVALIQLDVTVVLGPMTELVGATTPTAGAVSFLVLSLFCVGGVWGALAVLPPATVFGPTAQRRYQRIRVGIRYGAGIVVGGGSLLLTLVYLISVETPITIGVLEQTVEPIVTGTAVRTVLVQTVILLVLTMIGIRVFRSAGVALLYERPGWVPVAAMLTVVALLGTWQLADPIQATLIQTNELIATLITTGTRLTGDITVGLGVITLGIIGIIVILIGVVAGTRTGLLPVTTASARLVVIGLLITGIGATLGNAGTGVILLSILSAIVIWDIAEFGIGQTIAVGTRPARRDGALVAGGVSMLVGGVGVLLTGGLYYLLTVVAVDIQYGILPLGIALVASVLAIVMVYLS